MKFGITIIMIDVNIRDIPTAKVSSSFFALQAAAVAIAAETPHTDMSAEIVMFRVFEGIFNIFWDIFPATLDEFYQCNSADPQDGCHKDDGFSLAWGQDGDATFPRMKDFDGDGLLVKAEGGSDPNDSKWDSDSDDSPRDDAIAQLDPGPAPSPLDAEFTDADIDLGGDDEDAFGFSPEDLAARVAGEDSYIPLGPAASHVLPGEESILTAALKLARRGGS